jgi:Protein of unknown function (DUF2934)
VTAFKGDSNGIERSDPSATLAPRAAEGKEELSRTTGEQEIRDRAYELYLQRGAQPSRELEDWLQAERELCT